MYKWINILIFWIAFSIVACNQVKKAEIKSVDGYLVETFEYIGDSIKHGIQTKFLGKNITEEANYVNGELTGPRKLFFNNGQVEIEEIYVNGKLHGPHKIFYEDGSLHIESEYIDGKRQGLLKRYFQSGEIMEEVVFVDNEENGPFKEYYKNGKVQWEGNFLNGDNEFGELKQFDEAGALIKKMICDSMAVCQTVWTKEKGDIVTKEYELSHELEQ